MVDTRGGSAKRTAIEALWGDPLGPHSLENVGHEVLHVISTEMKPAGSDA